MKNFCSSALFLGLLTLIDCGSAIAQITPDGSLPTSVTSGDGLNFTIDNGARSGHNLFHSFREFSVPTNGSAFFNNAADVQNIFSRVTGGKISNIDGLIRANGGANLFLLNPAGIIFGPNARLNIGGSFFGTTADKIKFADGFTFNATDTTAPPLLTISVPVGLQMAANAGNIQIQGSPSPNSLAGLGVPTGQTLGLASSQIDMKGAKLTAANGRIELWGLRNAQIGIDKAEWQLASSANQADWGTISLRQSSSLDASGADGGAIHIQARGLTVEQSSILSRTVSGQGKGIAVQTTDFVNVSGVNLASGNQQTQAVFNSGLATFVSGNGGRAGDVTIETRRLEVSEGTGIRSISTGNGSRTGDITIRATDVQLNPLSSAAVGITGIATLLNGGSGETGNLTIEAQRIGVFNGGRLGTDLRAGRGKGGNVSILATESLEISGSNNIGIIGVTSAVGSTVHLDATGQGGNISIETGNLVLSNGGNITSSLGGNGTAGNIDIRATNVSVSEPVIDRNTQTLSGISVSVAANVVGQGGTINLTAENLRVFNGGQITSSSQGQGRAGSINIRANNIDVQGISPSPVNGQYLPSTIAASSTSTFAAGSVNLITDSLQVRDGAKITVSNSGTGDAGNLNIAAANIVLDNKASLQAEVNGGNQGNIQIQASDLLLLRHGSNILTNARGASTGGSIEIDAESIVAVPKENSDISANAVEGAGGNIQINTQGIFGLENRPQLTSESDITASSQFGISGTVNVSVLNVNQQNVVEPPPTNFFNTDQVVANSCLARQGSSQSTLAIAGNGGLPETPETATIPYQVVQVLATETSQATPRQQESKPTPTATPNWKPGDPIVEATEFSVNARGQVVLTANGNNGTGTNPQLQPIPCQPN